MSMAPIKVLRMGHYRARGFGDSHWLKAQTRVKIPIMTSFITHRKSRHLKLRGGVLLIRMTINIVIHPGRGHGGSHPHLVNEFLNALNENRRLLIQTAKRICKYLLCVGILAIESAIGKAGSN